MSIVYEVKCAGCGKGLDVEKVFLDSADDLCVEVHPCEYCVEVARQEGKESANSEA